MIEGESTPTIPEERPAEFEADSSDEDSEWDDPNWDDTPQTKKTSPRTVEKEQVLETTFGSPSRKKWEKETEEISKADFLKN